MAYKFQRGEAILSGALLQEGNVEVESGFSLVIGNASMSEADLEQLDGITAGTAAASKALVLDTNRDVSGVHAFTLSGSSSGQQQSKVIFGDSENSKLERIHDDGDELLRLISSDAGIDISGSHSLGVTVFGGDGDDAGFLVQGSNGLTVVNAAGNAAAVDLAQDGGVSGSGMLEMGGDVRLDGAGDTDLNVAQDSFYFFDLTNNLMKRDTMTDYANAIAGDGLAASSGVLSVGVHSDGGIEIASDSLQLNIDGMNALGGASIAQDDEFAMSDGGTVKKVTFSNFEDSIFANISGDATVAAGGALTIAADAVESGMLNDNVISGQTEMTGDVEDTDELMISDGGTLKRLDFSVLRDAVFTDVSGDATVAAGGALTIANGAVETAMVADDAITPAKLSLFDDSLAATNKHILIADGTDYSSFELSGDISMTNAGVVSIAADAVHATMLNDDVISAQTELAADGLAAADELLISDGGTLKKIGVDNLFLDGPALLGEETVAVGSDYIMFLDGGVTGDAKKESIADLVSAMAGAGLTATNGVLSADSAATPALKADGDTLQEGYNYFADISAANAGVDLPASPTAGDVVHVKAGNLTNDKIIRISAQGSHLIDGEATIDLESPFAAVSLVYVATNAWRIV